jgi:distribution and morphology protein 31
MYRTQLEILKFNSKHVCQPKFYVRLRIQSCIPKVFTARNLSRSNQINPSKMKTDSIFWLNFLKKFKGFKGSQVRKFSTNSEQHNDTKTKSKQSKKARWTRWFRLGFLSKPFSLDKIVGLLQLLFVFPGFIILVATTTVLGFIIWIINRSEKWQEWMNYYVGLYLSNQTGCDITFKSAVYSWKEGTIKLNKLDIIRDPKRFPPERDPNVSTIVLHAECVDVQISLLWWIQGNGWLKEVRGNGVRGFVDRRYLHFSENWIPPKRRWKRGSVYLTKLLLTDVQISLFNPNPKREIPIAIYTLDCNRFRQQWLLYDLLSSDIAVGSFDNCLFTLRRAADILRKEDTFASFLKINGLPFDLVSSTSATGPISWITEGTFDLEVDLHFVDEYAENEYEAQSAPPNAHNYLQMDFRLKLKNLHASVPLKPKELTYLSSALVHPVVAYMNANYTSIPLEFSLKIPKVEFDGVWTPHEVRLFDKISEAVAAAFIVLVNEQKKPSNIQKHLLHVILSFKRGIFFLWRQFQAQYQLWSFNNDEEWSIDNNFKVDVPE